MKLKKGDKVRVMVGKDRGKEAVVEKAWSKLGRVALPGVNIYKRHRKASSKGQKGGIIEFARPLPVANVALICPKCKQVTRVGYKLIKDGKARICRKCGEEI